MTEKDATTAEITQDHISCRCGPYRRDRRLHVLIRGIEASGRIGCISCAGRLKVKLDIELRRIQGLEALYGRTGSLHSCGIARTPGQRFGFQRQRADALLDALASESVAACAACVRAMIVDLKRFRGISP